MIGEEKSPLSIVKTLIDDINNSAPTEIKVFDPAEAFKEYILDQTKDYPAPVPLLYMVQNGERYPHRSKKSFSLQQGKQKSKKTTELAIEVAAYISPIVSQDNIRFECAEPGAVLFFDCEQGESYGARTMKLILKLAGLETCDKLKYFDLRELTPTKRLEIVEAAIVHVENVKWVVIDGIVDLMNDFMSAEEGHYIITQFLTLCSKFDIHVTGVLHQNKGVSKDARAHVGSIAGQKCEVEVMVERDANDKELSIVSAKESRGLPFEDFAIRWEKGGLPYIVQGYFNPVPAITTLKSTKAPEPQNIDISIHGTIIETAFLNQPPLMRRSELKPCIQLAVSEITKVPLGLNKIDLWIAYWLKENLLLQQGKQGTPSCKFFRPTTMFN